jgi:hypothetical protein
LLVVAGDWWRLADFDSDGATKRCSDGEIRARAAARGDRTTGFTHPSVGQSPIAAGRCTASGGLLEWGA